MDNQTATAPRQSVRAGESEPAPLPADSTAA